MYATVDEVMVLCETKKKKQNRTLSLLIVALGEFPLKQSVAIYYVEQKH